MSNPLVIATADRAIADLKANLRTPEILGLLINTDEIWNEPDQWFWESISKDIAECLILDTYLNSNGSSIKNYELGRTSRALTKRTTWLLNQNIPDYFISYVGTYCRALFKRHQKVFLS